MSAALQSEVGGFSIDVGLIGAGRLGTSLALALERGGHAVRAVASASAASALGLATRLTSASQLEVDALVTQCQLVLLAVPDAAIAHLARTQPWRRGQHVVHLSGALDIEVLEPARALGALCGCFHPLQTFPERFGDPTRFSGITCGVEGDGVLGGRLEQLAVELGARSLRLEGVDRARYHAAAVFASNYLVALHVAAAEAWTLAGLPTSLARSALAPLTQATAESVGRLPLESALTGPLKRGELATVAAHTRALETAPELRELYRRLGAVLLGLPLALSPEQRNSLAALLRSDVI